MAIAKGQSLEQKEYKRYIGVCPVCVVAVNPNKEELEKLFNYTLEKEPSYVEDVERDGKKFKNIRISLVLKPTHKDMPLFTMSFFITSNKVQSTKYGKYQIIDKYGRTTWATEDEIRNGIIPTFSNGSQAKIDKDYRIAYEGEENLTKFIKIFLGIPSIEKRDEATGSYVLNTEIDPSLCECRLDISTFPKLAKGDFSDIRDIIGYQPNNPIRVCLGVRTGEDGKQYQTVYTKEFASIKSKNFNKIEKAINSDIKYAMDNGRSIDTEYAITPVREYVVTPTTFQQNTTGDMPFDTNNSDPWA